MLSPGGPWSELYLPWRVLECTMGSVLLAGGSAAISIVPGGGGDSREPTDVRLNGHGPPPF